MSLGKKSLFSPFKLLSNIIRRPVTIRYPQEELDIFDRVGASPNYRGLHSNDIGTCIGCGTCQDICPTAAIEMVPAENVGDGKLGRRPKIDYGRCCFCAFCVDVCPSASLSMSRDYSSLFPTPIDRFGMDEVNAIKEDFDRIPGEAHIDNPGYVTPDSQSWLDLTRTPMGELAASARSDSFIEIVQGFSREQAEAEASRCVECGVCTETCPAKMNIPEYIGAIWKGDIEESVRQIYEDNPLPNVCGRVCTHKCETVCSIGHRGEPVAIRWLKRYAVDSLPVEEIKRVALERRVFAGKGKQKKVAVIGSGPAGLSAAYYLALMGHKVTIYDRAKKAGGVLRYGIPAYRLPDEALDRDLAVLEELGVEIKTGTEIGKTLPFARLQRQADAVLIASGFGGGRSTGIPGSRNRNCLLAIELLDKIASGRKVPLEKKIVVIGGGNVAFDIARSYARLQKKQYKKADVTAVCLEGELEVPADREEIEEGAEEGVRLITSRSPVEVLTGPGGKVRGLKTIRCVSVFDENGRFNPVTDDTDEMVHKADLVIEAIGQRPDYTYLGKAADSLEIIRGKVLTNKNGGTQIKGVFAAGDIVHGPDAIHAIADGHRSAKAIDAFLSGKGKKTVAAKTTGRKTARRKK